MYIQIVETYLGLVAGHSNVAIETTHFEVCMEKLLNTHTNTHAHTEIYIHRHTYNVNR